MITVPLTLLALISAVIHIRAENQGPPIQKYIFKPLTTTLIILIALLAQNGGSGPYQYLIVAGLLFSLAGDIFLMLPSDRFIAGLISFLIAHIFYIVAFVSDTGVAPVWGLVPFLVYGAIIYSFLAPHVGKLRVPVIIYMLAILVMAWQALGRWLTLDDTFALLALIGAVLFVVSDSILALNRFRQPFRLARTLTMATYYSAQWLIALSIGGL
jgi:uncharacterized membrane protein YhhN